MVPPGAGDEAAEADERPVGGGGVVHRRVVVLLDALRRLFHELHGPVARLDCSGQLAKCTEKRGRGGGSDNEMTRSIAVESHRQAVAQPVPRRGP